MKYLIAIPFAVAIGGLIVAYFLGSSAYVIACLWSWHVVPFGAPVLHWRTVLGVLLIIRLVKLDWSFPPPKPKDERPLETQFAIGLALVAIPWLSLAIGWCLR